MTITIKTLILLIYVIFIKSSYNNAILKNIVINKYNLSITSVIYNKDSTTSQYIDRIFGDKAIFLHKKNYDLYNNLSDNKIYKKYLNEGKLNIKNVLDLSQNELLPECSIELLGIVYLSKLKDDSYNPFTTRYRDIAPAIGKSILSINNTMILYNCYYRGLYENWFDGDSLVDPYHWIVVIYCPILDQTICQKINDFVGYYPINLILQLNKINYTTNFEINFDKRRTQENYLEYNSNYISFNDLYEPKLGICVAVTHTSSDNDKIIANSAMLYEWIRYYLKLGLRVLVYDRDGSNYNNVFNSPYSKIKGFDKNTLKYLEYNNYTIRGLLDESSKGIQWDNSQSRKDWNGFKKNSDKQYTLTHCRFEAKAKYNIDDIIVADFDEFLYCPVAGPSAKNQSTYLSNLISFKRNSGYDQLNFVQRVAANTTESIRTCIIERSQMKIMKSILNCFASFQYYSSFHSIKSLHIGLKCLLTGYHSSCPFDKGSMLSHDCQCTNEKIDNLCQFIHLTTNFNIYFVNAEMKYIDNNIIKEIQSNENELNLIIKSSNDLFDSNDLMKNL